MDAMALSSSPRKVVPLATGDEPKPSRSCSAPVVTKRAFYCGVVVEGSENGKKLSEEVQSLILSLGDPVDCSPGGDVFTPPSASPPVDADGPHQRQRALTDTSALSSVINELVATERSYVQRLHILKYDYADPLRKFSRSKDTAIIPAYEAKTLFGNIDNLLPVNEAFLTDLEKMRVPNGTETVGGVGDVALRHFKELKGFEHYKQYYIKREEAQSIFERELSKRSSGFAAFIDRIKYSSADSRNRIGLRELLMDPVQRVPRYTLMFRTMIKHMADHDPQRIKLIEADEIASKIALAETDEQTKRATIMYCLSTSVDGFPPSLFSHSRKLIDCIDAEDILSEPLSSGSSATIGSINTLHCSLFLFDDKLMIVKRPGNGEKGGKMLAGLDELDKVTRAGGLPASKKRSGMVFKGVVDITDVVATDVGGADIHLYLESPPQDQSERWSGRPFRSLAVVRPPMPVNLDPTQTEEDKHRFLENLWSVQARYRAKAGQSVILHAGEREVESMGGKVTLARTYYNVYQRTAFLQETKKTKVVIHVDALGSADPIPFGISAPPFVVIKIQPMAGELSRYNVSSSDPDDEGEEDIVQTARVSSRIVQTIHQYGLFKFSTGRYSTPSTPTASTRSRAGIFGLDAISRNLFNSRPASAMGDFFAGSINSHRRTKSTTSRSSAYTQSTSTADSMMKFSHRSNSTVTSATTMSLMDDDSFFANGNKSISISHKMLKRGKSLDDSRLDDDHLSRPRTISRSCSASRSRTPSIERDTDYSDYEPEDGLEGMAEMDESEWDLAMRLALARRNSRNQDKQPVPPISLDSRPQETIYEEEPPQPIRPASRASNTTRSTTPRPESDTPPMSDTISSHCRSTSQHSAERRPLGPRCPSPCPPASPVLGPPLNLGSAFVDQGKVGGTTFETISAHQNIKSAIPRSKRQPLFPLANSSSIPKPLQPEDSSLPASHIEPLSIKKKSSVPSSVAASSPSPIRRAPRRSPISKRLATSRQVSQIRCTKEFPSGNLPKSEDVERIWQITKATKEDIDSTHRAMKRIKLEIHDLRSVGNADRHNISRPSSPDKLARLPQRTNTVMTKAAQERMEEMRKVIGKRQAELPSQSRPFSMSTNDPSQGPHSPETEKTPSSLSELVDEAAVGLDRASFNLATLQADLTQLTNGLKERSTELQRARSELRSARRQCELVKSLLDDTTAEKEIMYEAFNEELDGMYNDINLPDDEAWTALTDDLRRTKEDRNSLSQENSNLKRKLAETELQLEEWGTLLRSHGLIS